MKRRHFLPLSFPLLFPRAGAGYQLQGGAQVGSTTDEVLRATGWPTRFVKGEPAPQTFSPFVFYRDIDGREGDGYYSRPDLGVCYLFTEGIVSAVQFIPKTGALRRLASIPSYSPDVKSSFQVDLRGADLSGMDLTGCLDNLLYAAFDDRTVWPSPDWMPQEFNPQLFLELGRDPGLGVRTLHQDGITGRGVSIAILDSPLLAEHEEYSHCLRLYEGINTERITQPEMHGGAVVSIAAGRTAGVAPEAEVHYIPLWAAEAGVVYYQYWARGVRRVLEINEQLPAEKKIRVISMSIGWQPTSPGYAEITAATEEAKAAGLLIVSSSIERIHGFWLLGLGRPPAADPNVHESYEPGLFWASLFYGGRQYTDWLFAPMDSRATASPKGVAEYVFYRQGGISWAIPYVAGVYALAVQVDPSITPERFWATAIETGRTITLTRDDRTFLLGPILDPPALIRSLRPE